MYARTNTMKGHWKSNIVEQNCNCNVIFLNLIFVWAECVLAFKKGGLNRYSTCYTTSYDLF